MNSARSDNQRFDKAESRVIIPGSQEFPMVQHAVTIDGVQRPLKGNGLIRPRACVEGNRRHHCFKVEVAGGRLKAVQQTAEIGCDIGTARYYRITDDDLFPRKRKSAGMAEMASMPSALSSSLRAADSRGR